MPRRAAPRGVRRMSRKPPKPWGSPSRECRSEQNSWLRAFRLSALRHSPCRARGWRPRGGTPRRRAAGRETSRLNDASSPAAAARASCPRARRRARASRNRARRPRAAAATEASPANSGRARSPTGATRNSPGPRIYTPSPTTARDAKCATGVAVCVGCACAGSCGGGGRRSGAQPARHHHFAGPERSVEAAVRVRHRVRAGAGELHQRVVRHEGSRDCSFSRTPEGNAGVGCAVPRTGARRLRRGRGPRGAKEDGFLEAARRENRVIREIEEDASDASDASDHDQAPTHLIVIDTTWHRARRMYARIPWIKTLPAYVLGESTPPDPIGGRRPPRRRGAKPKRSLSPTLSRVASRATTSSPTTEIQILQIHTR